MINPSKSTSAIPWLAGTIITAWIVVLTWTLISPPEPPVSLPVASPKPDAPAQP